MTKREAIRQTEQENRLMELGFTREEANALRRISMTLQRWFELECGNSEGLHSWAIERDENGEGKPFMVSHYYPPNRPTVTTRRPIADRETGARKRLAQIVAACSVRRGWKANEVDSLKGLSYYVQTDPRGAALYILRPGDIPEGADVSSYYTRGICVY